MSDGFRDFFGEVKPLRMKEPLAETLGAFQEERTVLGYTFADAVKLAGHACPTVAGAFLVCRKALERLYPGETPVRGEISVTVYGEPDEGVYGVMAQVLTLLTGAAPMTGFRGLGPKFKRKDLLRFDPRKPDPQAMCFEFKRMDTGRSVLVKFHPHQVPSGGQKGRRMAELLEKVIWDAARVEEKREFQEIWTGKVKDMLVEEKDIDRWLTIEERRNST
jgi:hypothetical protein